MNISRKIILGVVLLLLVALILYFINRRNNKEGFYEISDQDIILNKNSLTDGNASALTVRSQGPYHTFVSGKSIEISDIINFGPPFKNSKDLKIYTKAIEFTNLNDAKGKIVERITPYYIMARNNLTTELNFRFHQNLEVKKGHKYTFRLRTEQDSHLNLFTVNEIKLGDLSFISGGLMGQE